MGFFLLFASQPGAAPGPSATRTVPSGSRRSGTGVKPHALPGPARPGPPAPATPGPGRPPARGPGRQAARAARAGQAASVGDGELGAVVRAAQPFPVPAEHAPAAVRPPPRDAPAAR